MITGIITFSIIVIMIGSILYGRRLVKTEKTDAVFGNPERAKGGMHWIIVGTSFLILSWLYYSWDIAKSIYPQSANELCQVAKVTESLLSLKYLFPIEERQLKSTALIKRETDNINNYIFDIKRSSKFKDPDKKLYLDLLNKVQSLIPLLTNERYLEKSIKNKIINFAKGINVLAENFPNTDYPPIKSLEIENKRLESLKSVYYYFL